jgi:hypothetical protein
MTIVHTQTTLRVLHGARLKSTAASSKKTKAAKPGKTVLGWGELPTSLVGASGEQVVPLAPFKEVKSKRTKGESSLHSLLTLL